MKSWFSIICLVLFSFPAWTQTETEYAATYAQRIKMEMIDGVYIPKNFEEAFGELERLAEIEGVKKFKAASEEVVRTKFQLGLGRWIFVNWGMEEGSRYSDFLHKQGITYPDEMITFTLVAWHRHLHGKPLNVEGEVASIKKRVEAEMAKKESEKIIISKETRPHKEK